MNSRKILIVDDDEDLRLMMAVRIRREGHLALCAANSAEALVIVAQEVPDLILLDLGTLAANGYWLLARLKDDEEFEDIPVIVVSGYPADIHGPRSLDAGAVAFFSSPAEWSDLKMAINLAFASSPRRREMFDAQEARA